MAVTAIATRSIASSNPRSVRAARVCMAWCCLALVGPWASAAEASASTDCSPSAVLQAPTIDDLRKIRLACSDDVPSLLALIRINAWPLPKPVQLTLQPPSDREETVVTEADFFFNLEEAYLPEAGFVRMARLIQTLNRSSRILTIELTGMADITEVGAANVRNLGILRAENIKQYLLAAGLPAHQVVLSVIESFPGRGNDPESRAKDRSVHLRAISRRSPSAPAPALEPTSVEIPGQVNPPVLEAALQQANAMVRYARSRMLVESAPSEELRAYVARLKQQLRERFRTEVPQDLQQVAGGAKVLFEVDALGAVQQSWIAGYTGSHQLANSLQTIVRRAGNLDPVPPKLRDNADRVFAGVIWEQPADLSLTRAIRLERPLRPQYPPMARRLGQEGGVLIEVRVLEDGRPTDARVEQSSGHPLLDQAALEAVQNATFVPAGAENKAASQPHRIPISFALEPSNYVEVLRRFVRRHIMLSETVDGNPAAEVSVNLTADGEIINRTLVSPSGSQAWDTAVLRALDRAGRLPLDAEGRIAPRITFVFRPRD
jgi:TonB family protein